MAKEKIICSAIWYKDLNLKRDIPSRVRNPKNVDKGIVFCGHRHAQCLYTMVAITGLKQYQAGEEIQGFLTNKNRFVDRIEGGKIFVSNGNKLNYSSDELFSEDLY